MNKLLIFCITLGPVGYLKGSGTYASFVTALITYFINSIFSSAISFYIACVVTILGFYLVKLYLKESKSKDPSEVVVDEVSGQMFCSSFCGVILELHIFSFILFRFLDILKPFPINRLELLKGSIGVMADDLCAAFITIIILISIRYFMYF